MKVIKKLLPLLLLVSFNTQAFYFAQAFNHSKRQQDGIRLGYHNENPDMFWRAYLSYSPSLNKVLANDHYGKTDFSLDWVVPLAGTYSSAFLGGTINQQGQRSLQAGITWLKYVETGWHWRDGNATTYLGVNLTF